MKSKFSKIVLSSSTQNERIISIARQIFEILSSSGTQVMYDQSLSELDKLKKTKSINMKEIISTADLLIAIGGDGTMLNCSRKYGTKGIPILGINLGQIGFLSEIAPKDVTTRLLEVIDGDFVEDKRFFLGASINDKSQEFTALNEVVIHSGAIAQLIEFELFLDDHFVYRQKADGLIVNSPTGSTAYSLSGGGPILHPNVDAITLLPMFPQSLSTSALVINSDSNIRVELIRSDQSSHVSFDSQDNVTLKGKQIIKIQKASPTLTLIHPTDHDFFGGCRNKLGWSMDFSNTLQ